MQSSPVTVLTSEERDALLRKYLFRRRLDRLIAFAGVLALIGLTFAIAYLIVYPPHWPADPAPTEETDHEAEHPGL